MDTLLDEAIYINSIFWGAFSFSDLKDMAFDNYENVLSKARTADKKK